MIGRELYDDHIPAADLRVGDELHLTFMGGDGYCTIEDVAHADGWTRWHATYYGPDLSDQIPSDKMVWVKKRGDR